MEHRVLKLRIIYIIINSISDNKKKKYYYYCYLRYIKIEAHTTKFTHVYVSHTCSLSHRKTKCVGPTLTNTAKPPEADQPPAGSKKFRRIRRRCQNNQTHKNHPPT